jgi:FtsP/CotA-like multicopper oxidase with cupredoxin domain
MNAGAASHAGPPSQSKTQSACCALHAQRLAADPCWYGCAEFTLTNGVYQPTIIMEARAPAPADTASFSTRKSRQLCGHAAASPRRAFRAAQAGKIYRWRIVQASISKWMDVSLDRPGCTLGLYARDGNFLRAVPRPVTNIMAAAANRLELLVACQAGDYKLRTGYGPLVPDAQCMSTHCELIKDVIANIKVVRGRPPRRRL